MHFIRKDSVEIRYKYYMNGNKEELCISKKDIDSLPVTKLKVKGLAEKEPAKWIYSLDAWMCSKCESQEKRKRNFCPECGSKMRNPDVLPY